MLIIAIDLGKFNSVACLYNTQTQNNSLKRSQPIAGSEVGHVGQVASRRAVLKSNPAHDTEVVKTTLSLWLPNW